MSNSFTDLYYALSDTQLATEKVALLLDYFRTVEDTEFGWAVFLFKGGKCRGGVRSSMLRAWIGEDSELPEWLVQECYGVVGDLAETVTLLVSSTRGLSIREETRSSSLLEWIHTIQNLELLDISEKRNAILEIWRSLGHRDLLVFNKLLTGGLRIGVSKAMVVKALSRLADLPIEGIWQRLAGELDPLTLTKSSLLKPCANERGIAPYPFYLAYPLQDPPDTLGPLEQWQVEWKWDGIRAQLVRRGDQIALWSRGDELISESFPEIIAASQSLPPQVVLDGEIVAWNNGRPGSFFDLQKRLNKRRVTRAHIVGQPTRFLVYDLLEYGAQDLRATPLAERRALLERYYAESFSQVECIELPRTVDVSSWEELIECKTRARESSAEGMMLKRRDSVYGVGRTLRGAWWKWKCDPYSVDAVLIYAQKGHGRRADLYTDYTLGVWDGESLVSFAKAYTGLTDRELVEVDQFIKRNTLERFGPVRTVKPELVFELAFDSIQASKRHRSGVAVRFPRIVRWRKDKVARDADSLETVRKLL